MENLTVHQNIIESIESLTGQYFLLNLGDDTNGTYLSSCEEVNEEEAFYSFYVETNTGGILISRTRWFDDGNFTIEKEQEFPLTSLSKDVAEAMKQLIDEV